MNKTIQIIGHICKKHRFQEKLLFVPSYFIGHQIGEYLAKTEAPWINLRVTTTAGHAQALSAFYLNKNRVRLIESHERLVIIEKLYRRDDVSAGGGAYFEAAAEIQGILKCLSSAVHEMRMAGLDHKGIDPDAFITPEKAKELIWLLDSYDHFLKENRLIDHPGLLSVAIDRLKKEYKPEKDRLVMVLSDFPFAHLEKELIRLTGGDNLIVIGHTQPVGFDFPGRFFKPAQRFNGKDLRPESDIDLLPWLFQSEKAPGPFQDGSVSIFHALGESNEVREVFRRILKEEIPLDDVEILVTNLDPYVTLIYEIATSLGISATFAPGIPITYTRPGKALLLYLRWQAEEFRASYLRRLFSGGYIELASFKPKEGRPSLSTAAALLRDAAIGWGRDRYSIRLKSLADTYRCKAEEKREDGEEDKARRAESKAREATWLDSSIRELMATVPSPNPEGMVTTRELCKGALDLLRKFCRTISELDRLAKSSLLDILESLVSSPSITYPAKECAERLTEVIKGVSVGHLNPEPGSVHVAHYQSGGYSGRSHTFMLGLDQNKFPGKPLQNPVILDLERQQLGKGMPLSGELLHEELYVFVKVLASFRGKVTLSYSCRDLREDREILPSSMLLGVYRLITSDRLGDYRALITFLGEPVGFIPKPEAAALNDWEWWLSQRKIPYGSGSVHACYPHLLEGERAENRRDLEELGEYDGWVKSSSGALDPVAAELVLSCSQLEYLARCPYAFFVRHVLGIDPLEDIEIDKSRWLHPIQRGELLHEVFCRFMEELKSRDERPNFKRHMERLQVIAMEEVKEWKDEVPPVSELAFDLEVAEIRQSLRIFLMNEEERCKGLRPCFFELSFGTGKGRRCGTFSEEPVEIKLGGKGSFKLRGRIDRVDQCGAHEYEVWDYKTGGTWGYKEEGYLNRGRHLQHALYAVAAEILLRKSLDKKAKVVRAGYFFPSSKGEGLRIEKEQLSRVELYDVLEDLFELLRSGVFPSSHDKDPCGICPYNPMCGGPEVAVKRCKRKLSADKKLEPFRRLKEHA